MKIQTELVKAKDAIKACNFLLITAGAGIGVDSGLPDFRGPQGFWKCYPPMEKLGLSFQEMSNPRSFYKDPSFAWGFYGHRYELYKNTTPHKGFEILKSWTKNKEYFIFTSNVDGHFQNSGFPEEKIVECHGSIHYLQCLEYYKCTLDIWPMYPIVYDKTSFRAKEPLPHCVHCKGLARPNILMFGDSQWISDRVDQQFQRLSEAVNKKKWKITVIEIGAGETVSTVRIFGENFIHRDKATFVRINPDKPFDKNDSIIHVQMKGLEAIETLDKLLLEN